MNAIRKTDFAELARLGIEEATEGLEKGVYEMFSAEADDEHDGDWIDLIDTGGLSVNCQCLVVADTESEAQALIDECDPAASGCDDTHLWLPTPLASLHTLEAKASGQMYVLGSDIREKHLSDDQVRAAINAAARNEGEIVITTTGSVERYIDVGDITVPVLGCRLYCDECGCALSETENSRNASENADEGGNSYWCDDCAGKKRAEAEETCDAE